MITGGKYTLTSIDNYSIYPVDLYALFNHYQSISLYKYDDIHDFLSDLKLHYDIVGRSELINYFLNRMSKLNYDVLDYVSDPNELTVGRYKSIQSKYYEDIDSISFYNDKLHDLVSTLNPDFNLNTDFNYFLFDFTKAKEAKVFNTIKPLSLIDFHNKFNPHI